MTRILETGYLLDRFSIAIRCTCLIYSVAIGPMAMASVSVSPSPNAHLRFSSDGTHYVSLRPRHYGDHEGGVHSIHQVNGTGMLWEFEQPNIWMKTADESDRCVFMANDGTGVAVLTWYQTDRYVPTELLYEFWTTEGLEESYPLFDPDFAWRVPILHFPVELVWKAVFFEGFSPAIARREGELISIPVCGLRTVEVDLRSGQIVRWRWNMRYLFSLAVVCAPPILSLSVWVIAKLKPRPESQRDSDFSRSNVLVGAVLLLCVFALITDYRLLGWRFTRFMLGQPVAQCVLAIGVVLTGVQTFKRPWLAILYFWLLLMMYLILRGLYWTGGLG